MCGIVGFVGRQEAAPVLLDGLARLEYRGYDSAGVAIYSDGGLKVAKATGRLQVLSDLIQGGAAISGQLGMKVPFHRYGQDTVVERVSAAELSETYRGMEIASHTRAHTMDAPDPAAEIERSLEELSRWSGQTVRGLAYPGGQYTAAMADMVRATRVEYARGASPTHDLSVPNDWYAWEPSCHYADAETPALIDAFLAAPH